MAGKRSGKKNRRTANGKARRRATLGLGGCAGAFLAFGLTPLASVPPAHADGLDAIIDPVINSILSSVTSFDALLGIDPTTGLDLATSFDALLGIDPTTGLDLALPSADVASAVPSGWEALFGDFSNPAGDVGTAASATDSATSTFWQGLEQSWINSSFGSQVDTSLNSWFDQVDPAAILGLGRVWVYLQRRRRYRRGSLTAADGEGGGIFFGNGGNGATDHWARAAPVVTRGYLGQRR